MVGQGAVAGQLKVLEFPTDSVRNLYIRFHCTSMVCIKKSVVEEKEVIAMKLDPLLHARLWRILQPDINPQLYHQSVQGLWKYPLYVFLYQYPKRVFKSGPSLKTHVHLNSESAVSYIMS